ncbi:MAG: lytic transglycosylase domain-containing protein [Syntrophales bacterium]|nr:lytic transglycosylase domain-containing protein [Syntrophales bacterium]
MKITGGGLRIEVREVGTTRSSAAGLNHLPMAHPALEIIARELGRLPFELVDVQVSSRRRARKIGGIPPRCGFSKGGGGNIEKLIHKYAAHYKIDPELIKAIMRRESGFNPGAVSPKGAQGLMQLMPGTSNLMGVKNPFDPEQNIAGGVAYLRHCLDRFDDNVVLAVAAYNAGPHRVAKCGEIPRIAETQSFVRNVVAEYLDRSGKSRTDSCLAYLVPAVQLSPAVSPSLVQLPRKQRSLSARTFSITLIEIKPKTCSKPSSLQQ